jgi:hypothetical protein
MTGVNRSELIELLDQLGAETDDAALGAARALHRKVSDAGLTWGELLRAEGDTLFGGTDTTGEGPLAIASDDEPATQASATPDVAEAARLIDCLLARQTISETLREDLTALKDNIAKGEFDAMDARYVGALAKRLDA